MPSTPERDLGNALSSTSRVGNTRSPARSRTCKQKRPPPLTPRRHKKFFTPRVAKPHNTQSSSRKALHNICRADLNRRANFSRIGALNDCPRDGDPANSEARSSKRRLSALSDDAPFHSPPVKTAVFFPPSSQELPDNDSVYTPNAQSSPLKDKGSLANDFDFSEDEHCNEAPDGMSAWKSHGRPIRTYQAVNNSTSLLSARLSGRRTKKEPLCSDFWQEETKSFYSGPADRHMCQSIPIQLRMALPFSSASCNLSSLVAVGDEEGCVRLLDSKAGDKDGFTNAFLTWRPHYNAIIDLSFSEDDMFLVTSSGDQTSLVIDMKTQVSIYRMSQHGSTVKQAIFQQGSGNNIIATCSRDGNINIWDLRCWHFPKPALSIQCTGHAKPQTLPQDGSSSVLPGDTSVEGLKYITLANQIHQAHSTIGTIWNSSLRRHVACHSSERSVTSIAFLPDASRSYLLASSCSSNSIVKLWDLRTSYAPPNGRRAQPAPVSSTREPFAHTQTRPYGLNSLVFNTSGSRLYALCTDDSIYAYSTSHLILGNAPEFSPAHSKPRRPNAPERPGMGPLFALRHKALHIRSFYPKLALRKSGGPNDQTELLAAGSSENCAVLFPPDERHLTRSTRSLGPRRADEDFPVYEVGMELQSGHQKEVTSLSWNSDGGLTTCSDDFFVRCWRSDGERAQELRAIGEGRSGSWGCGWANLGQEEKEQRCRVDRGTRVFTRRRRSETARAAAGFTERS